MLLYEQLKEIGLNEKEAKVYLASLKLGPSTISNVARQAKIKRTTVYEVMKGLQEQQIVSVTAKGKRKLYVATEPENLIKILQKKEELLGSILPQLSAMSQTGKKRPTIQIFEGIDGIKTIYKDTLHEKQTIRAFVDYKGGAKELLKWADEKYIPQRIKKNIEARVIAPDSEESRIKRVTDLASNRETRLIPQEKYPFSIEINIYGNKTAFISFKENELFGIIVESPEIAKTMKMIFKFFWEHTK